MNYILAYAKLEIHADIKSLVLLAASAPSNPYFTRLTMELQQYDFSMVQLESDCPEESTSTPVSSPSTLTLLNHFYTPADTCSLLSDILPELVGQSTPDTKLATTRPTKPELNSLSKLSLKVDTMKSGDFTQDSFIMAQKQDANIAALRSNLAANPRLHLKLVNNILYKNFNGNCLPVLPLHYEDWIFASKHFAKDGAHVNKEEITRQISCNYYVSDLEKKVNNFCHQCSLCKTYTPPPRRQPTNTLSVTRRGDITLSLIHI